MGVLGATPMWGWELLGSTGAGWREKGSLPATLPQRAMGAKLFWLGDLELWLPHQRSTVMTAQLGWVVLPTALLLRQQ